jgi:Na+/melibiose symporter-like transporter
MLKNIIKENRFYLLRMDKTMIHYEQTVLDQTKCFLSLIFLFSFVSFICMLFVTKILYWFVKNLFFFYLFLISLLNLINLLLIFYF